MDTRDKVKWHDLKSGGAVKLIRWLTSGGEAPLIEMCLWRILYISLP